MLEDVLHTSYSDTIVVGDFNCGCIKWESKSTIMRYVSADLFLDTIGNLFFRTTSKCQLNNFQTILVCYHEFHNNIFF